MNLRRTGEAPATSIAVLPFVDMTNDKTEQPFCDGVTEELSNWLAGRARTRTSQSFDCMMLVAFPGFVGGAMLLRFAEKTLPSSLTAVRMDDLVFESSVS